MLSFHCDFTGRQVTLGGICLGVIRMGACALQLVEFKALDRLS